MFPEPAPCFGNGEGLKGRVQQQEQGMCLGSDCVLFRMLVVLDASWRWQGDHSRQRQGLVNFRCSPHHLWSLPIQLQAFLPCCDRYF